MEVHMFNIDEEKDKLEEKLSEQYSQDIITIEEYERILEYLNKIETKKEVNVIEKIMEENNITNANKLEINKITYEHLLEYLNKMETDKETNIIKEIKRENNTSYNELNQIIKDNLPEGKKAFSIILGLIKMLVSKILIIVVKIIFGSIKLIIKIGNYFLNKNKRKKYKRRNRPPSVAGAS
jgi:hypothetical protein